MSFSWVKFYNELFLTVVKNHDPKSIATLAYSIFGEAAMMDKDTAGKRLRFEELDPCSFLARFNRGEKLNKRIQYCEEAKRILKIQADTPSDFDGIPVANNMNWRMFPDKHERNGSEIKALWAFAKDLASGNLTSDSFNRALGVRYTADVNLTVTCFVVWPDKFLPLDKRTKKFLATRDPSLLAIVENLKSMSDPFSAYVRFLDAVRSKLPGKNFAEVSRLAYEESADEADTENDEAIDGNNSGITYWVAGAAWKGDETPDKTVEFIRDGVWKNGYGEDSGDKSVENVKLAKPGDFIAIKSSSTKGPGRKTSFLKVTRSGVPKRYEERSENLDCLKGKISFARNSIVNAVNQSKVSQPCNEDSWASLPVYLERFLAPLRMRIQAAPTLMAVIATKSAVGIIVIKVHGMV